MCTKLQTLGQFCQPVGEHDANNNQDDHVSTYTGNCPCGQGLVCIDAVSSTSEEDDSSANSGGLGVCQNTEPEKDDDQPAEWSDIIVSLGNRQEYITEECHARWTRIQADTNNLNCYRSLDKTFPTENASWKFKKKLRWKTDRYLLANGQQHGCRFYQPISWHTNWSCQHLS